MDSPENVDAEPRPQASADDRGDATQGRVPPSAQQRRRKVVRRTTPGRRGGDPSKELLAKEELQRESNQTAKRHPASSDKGKEQGERQGKVEFYIREARRWKQGCVVKGPYVLEVAAKAALGHEKEGRAEDRNQKVARTPPRIPKGIPCPL